MHLDKLKISRFKNHEDVTFGLIPQINCFHGPNGVGKTNLLDAIYFLGNGRGYFSRSDHFCIPAGEDYANWEGEFVHQDLTHNHRVVLQENARKKILRNGADVDRLSDFIRFFPMVMITPGDIELVTGHGEVRRKLLDRTISLSDQDYLTALQRYNKLLAHRNELLKKSNKQRHLDEGTLEAIDSQMIPEAIKLFEKRKMFIDDYKKIVTDLYSELSLDAERAEITYRSQLHDNELGDLLRSNLKADLIAQRTSYGPHKDDLKMMISDLDIRKYGSQGQIKTFTISLQLGVFKMLKMVSGKIPILLLDDIFEKIDDLRADRLMELIAGESFGQIFITDTSKTRMEDRLQGVQSDKKFFNIERSTKVRSNG